MITRLKNRLNRFVKEDVGAMHTVEFAVMFPLLCAALLFGVELTTHSNRQFQLDRGLEVTTRAIRLHTGSALSHAQVKQSICDNAGGLNDCVENLKLEMIPMNPRAFTSLPSTPDCTSAPAPATPVRGWSVGQQHELMLMRACYQYDPVMPFIGLGRELADDSNGKGTMVSISAFVQEPN